MLQTNTENFDLETYRINSLSQFDIIKIIKSYKKLEISLP